MGSPALKRAREKMVDAGVDPVAIDTFAHYFRLLEHGETGHGPRVVDRPGRHAVAERVEVDDEVGRRGDPAHRRRSSSTAVSAPRWA